MQKLEAGLLPLKDIDARNIDMANPVAEVAATSERYWGGGKVATFGPMSLRASTFMEQASSWQLRASVNCDLILPPSHL